MCLQKPPIDSSSDEGEKPSEMNGMIELKNVTFRYPSRDEVPVITVLYTCYSDFCVTIILATACYFHCQSI